MSRVKSIIRNLRSFFTQDYLGRWQAQEARLEHAERRADERFDEIEHRSDGRADGYEAAVDARLEERLMAAEHRSEARASAYEAAMDMRVEERLVAIEQRIDGRATANERRIDERLLSAAADLDQQLTKALKALDHRFDKRSRAVDLRVDDRLAQLERHIDDRFETLERRADARMETHERKVDGKIHQTSQDIVDRNDLMLQIFEQRLDKLRRELRALRESLAASLAPNEETKGEIEFSPGGPPAAKQAEGEDPHRILSSVIGSTNGAGAKPALDHRTQLQSFRKLAESLSGARPKPTAGEMPLYHKILAWKKTAKEGINDFTPDEQETIDYILSFISDPKEIAYAKQHLRRFVSTLQRIPPAQKTSDRLLELGSLFHLTPAIKKYCGYDEICCADVWDGPEKVTCETLRQKGGPDSYSFELRNFDVEREPFPYPDGHFRTVLCCELIEHLQSDPLHMLWECNRVLEADGYLLLTTPNIASCRAIEGVLVGCTPYLLPQYDLHEVVDQHNREYAPYEVGVALSAAGFTIVEMETEDVWMRSNPAILELLKQVQISTELRGDNIFALARKTGAPVERYPKELYVQ